MKTKNLLAIAVFLIIVLSACMDLPTATISNARKITFDNYSSAVYSICDSEFGNLIYKSANGGIAVVAGGCRKNER